MKLNYQSWKVDFEDFYKKKDLNSQLLFFVQFALLAPSSHNSQPWKYKIVDNSIIISPNFQRALHFSDPNNRQLFISLGCALENLIITADYFGFKTTVEYHLDGVDNNEIKVSFDKLVINSRNSNHLIFSIPQRHTNRNKYSVKSPDKSFLDWIKEQESDGTSLSIVVETEQKNSIADLVIFAGINAMNDNNFRSELSKYVKSNLTKSSLGMPGFGFGMPTPPSLLLSKLIKYFNMSKVSKKVDEELLKKFTSCYFIISTRDDNKESWVRVGQLYERIALKAQQNNLKTNPLAAVVQIGESYKDLQRILQSSYRPQFFCRIGYTDQFVEHSPRLSLQDVTTQVS